jgi:hypothetical protein
VRADHKKRAHINVMRHLLHALASPKLSKTIDPPDPDVVFPFEAGAIKDGRLER